MQGFLKSAVAVAVLGLGATAALAAPPPIGVDPPQPLRGNGGLTFYAYDSSNATSLIVYLGLDLDSVLPPTLSPDVGSTIDFGVLPSWSTAFAAGTGGVKWSVTAGDSVNVDNNTSTTFNGRRLATTSTTTLAANALRNSAMQGALTNINDYLARVIDNANCPVNSPCVAPASNPAYAGLLKDNIAGVIGGANSTPFTNTAVVNSSMEFYLFSGNGSSTVANTTQQRYQNSLGQAGLFSLTADGHLVWSSPGLVSEVPLPAAAWLLLSGLTGFGAIARRRPTKAAA